MGSSAWFTLRMSPERVGREAPENSSSLGFYVPRHGRFLGGRNLSDPEHHPTPTPLPIHTDFVAELGGVDPVSVALSYHQESKHHLDRYARSAGYLDWASQPDP